MAAIRTKKFQVSARVHSPRWGHEDTYTLTFDSQGVQIDNGNAKSANCSFPNGDDPEWTGYNHAIGNALLNILSNDAIYAPNVIPLAVESAWQRWSEGDASDEEVRAGIEELFAWINQTAKSTPRSKFWTGVF